MNQLKSHAEYRSVRVVTFDRIPSHWKVLRGRNLVQIGTGSGDTVDADADGDFPFYVRSNKPLRSSQYEFTGPAVLTAGDGAGGAKVFHLVGGRFMAHQRVYVMREFKFTTPEFFHYAFSSLFRFMALDGSAKSTVDSVRRDMIANMPFAVPPEPEQRAITGFLDRETAQIDALIEKQERLIETLRERRQAVIDRTIGPKTGNSRTFGSRSVGGIASGVDFSAGEGEEGWPRYVRTTDVSGMDSLTETSIRRVSWTQAGRSTIRRNDILLTRSGSLGTNYLHESDEIMAFAGYMVRFRPRVELCDPRFVAWWLQSRHHLDQVALGASSSTIDNFSASKFRAMRLPLPPLDEQRRIAAYLDEQTAKIDALIGKAERFIELSKERRAALITAAVTGQIDVREAV